MKKNNTTTVNKAVETAKTVIKNNPSVDTPKSLKRPKKELKTATTVSEEPDTKATVNPPADESKLVTTTVEPIESGELPIANNKETPIKKVHATKGTKQSNLAAQTSINVNIPCAETLKLRDERLARKEKRTEQQTKITLNKLHHSSSASEKAFADHCKRKKETAEAIQKKKELIKAMTPERLAELAKRRIVRVEKADAVKVNNLQKKNVQLSKFIAAQAARNVKKTLKSKSHTPEQLAKIKADCDARKAAKKARNIAAQAVYLGGKPNSYTAVCSFVRKDGTTYTLNKDVLFTNVSYVRKWAQTLFEKWTVKATTRSKSITKLGVYPNFGNDWGNSVFTAGATETKLSKAMANATVTKEVVKEAQVKHENAVTLQAAKQANKKQTKAERLAMKYADKTAA